jgi:4-hydroxy-3-polyprenylbenzoate decarboxylase
MRETTLAITGASGSACARRLLRALASHPEVARVNALMSSSALTVARVEIGPKDASMEQMRSILCDDTAKIRWFAEHDVGAAIASGSYPTDGTCIVPCSTGTLGAIASGASRNLIHRAAEVALKERRKLILGVREAPYSAIHLQNMLAVTQAGAIVLPITPAFYSEPKTIDDVVDLYVGRVMDHLGLEHQSKRWGV